MNHYLPWNIIHLDLSQEISPLPLEPGYAGMYLVLWWHTLPLGQLEIPTSQLPMPAAQVLTLALAEITPTVAAQLAFYHQDSPPLGVSAPLSTSPLETLWQYWNQPIPQPQQTVSVVVCTRDRPDQLALCLQSLQQLSPAPYEILVVDNAPSTEATQQLVEQMPQIRYIREPRPGLSAARNTGIQQSTGEIIAFTDDDVTVQPDWIDRLSRSFRDPQVVAVTGLILPKELKTESQILFEMEHGCLRGNFRSRLFDQTFFNQTRAIGSPVWQIGAGANMAFRQQVFQSIGLFDERLGAGASGCSEDSELWYRILAAGWTCFYEPAVVVYHCHRRELERLQSQLYQYMQGHIAALLIQFAQHRHWGNLYRVFLDLPYYYLRCFTMGLLTGFRGKYRTTFAEILGCLAGGWFYLQQGKRSGRTNSDHGPPLKATGCAKTSAGTSIPS